METLARAKGSMPVKLIANEEPADLFASRLWVIVMYKTS
jgi:hypothetical protein